MDQPLQIPLHAAERGRSITMERIVPAEGQVLNSVHRHDYSEVFVFSSGTGEHMIDLKVHAIKAPCAHVVRGGQVHHLVRSGDMEGFVFEFTNDALKDATRHADAQALFAGMSRMPGLPLDQERMNMLNDLARMLEVELAAKGNGQEQVLTGYLGIVLAKCARWWSEALPQEDPIEAMHTDLLDRYRKLVDEQYLTLQQVKDYAELLHVTPGHLNDVVRKRLGTTAGALIDERIQLEAKRLLLHSELSMKETGFAIGMKDPAYFARWFKRVEGVSPLDYRNSVREKYR